MDDDAIKMINESMSTSGRVIRALCPWVTISIDDPALIVEQYYNQLKVRKLIANDANDAIQLACLLVLVHGLRAGWLKLIRPIAATASDVGPVGKIRVAGKVVTWGLRTGKILSSGPAIVAADIWILGLITSYVEKTVNSIMTVNRIDIPQRLFNPLLRVDAKADNSEDCADVELNPLDLVAIHIGKYSGREYPKVLNSMLEPSVSHIVMPGGSEARAYLRKGFSGLRRFINNEVNLSDMDGLFALSLMLTKIPIKTLIAMLLPGLTVNKLE